MTIPPRRTPSSTLYPSLDVSEKRDALNTTGRAHRLRPALRAAVDAKAIPKATSRPR
jgi:hypothetical protein